MPAVSARRLGAPKSGRRARGARLDENTTPDELRRQLVEVATTFADDLAVVDRELEHLVRSGPSPAIESALHLFEAGGKRVRPLLVILSAACFRAPTASAHAVGVAAELVHLATLLHDDVVDDGQERRGRPTSRRIWGNAVSVLSGDLLLTHALQTVAARAPASVLTDLLSTLRRLVDGEVVQLESRTNVDMNEETYLRVARDKTASLFEWAARSGAACAGAPPSAADSLGAFGAHVGLAFQLIDDVLDYDGDPAALGEALLVDLLEGKPTLPLIRAIALNPAIRADVESIRAGDEVAVVRVAEAVRSSNACSDVRALAREESRLAELALRAVPSSPARSTLERIARGLAERIA